MNYTTPPLRILNICFLGLALALFMPLSAPFVQAQAPIPSAEVKYAQALTWFEQGLYQQASKGFREFEATYPNHPNAGDAHYYQAEALLALGHAEEAAPLYANFPFYYPSHPLADKAQLSLGRYYYDRTQYDLARQQFANLFQHPIKPEVGSVALYWMGMSSSRLQQPDAAIDYFQQLLKAYPQSALAPSALYMAGKAELERRNYAGASAAFEQLNAQYPTSPLSKNTALAVIESNYQLKRYDRVVSEGEKRITSLSGRDLERALLLIGESANQLKDYNRAQYYFGNLIQNFPNSSFKRYANFGQAWATHYKNNFAQAAVYFGQAKEQQRDELAHRAAYYEAVNLGLAGQRAQALQRYEELVNNFPNGEFTDQALYELGSGAYDAKNYEGAIRALDALTAHFPNSPRKGEAYYLLGEAFNATGNAVASARAFDLAGRESTLPANFRNNVGFRKGWVFYQNKQYADAITAFQSYYQTTKDATSLFWIAESQFQLGNIDESERTITRYITEGRNDPNINIAQYILGYINYNKKQYAESAKSFERFLANYKETPEQRSYKSDALQRLGDSYYALKRFDDAVATYRKVGNDGAVYALFQSGLSYANSGQTADAINTFRRLIGSYPNSQWAAEAQYNIGYLYLQQQQYDQALIEYRRVIQFYPNTEQAAKAQYGIGDALFNQDKYNESIVAYREIVTRYPNSPLVADALVGIQQASNALGGQSVTMANSEIDTYLHNNPNSPIADQLRFKRSENLFQQGMAQDALTGFEAFLQSNKSPQLIPQATFYSGACHILLNNTVRGEQLLKNVLSSYPNDPAATDAARDLGGLFLNNSRYAEAFDMYKRLEAYGASEPDVIPEALLGQGFALLAQDNTDSGKAILNRIISTYPQTDEARQAQLRLGNLYLQHNQITEAMDMFKRLGASGSDSFAAEAQFRYGTLLLQQNKAQDALTIFNTIPTRFPDELDWIAQGYLGKARAHKLLGQRSQAIQAYDKVINEFGDTPFADIARAEKSKV